MAPHPLLLRLFDYAGLFPPAALPLDAAAADFVRHRARPEASMLARFVVPAAQAGALAAQLPPDLPTTLAVLATPLDPGADVAAAAHSVQADVARVADLVAAHPALAVDALEVRPPDAVLASPETLGAVLAAVDAVRPADLRLAVELPWGLPDEVVEGLLGALRDAGAALKLRTVGTTPEAFPTVDALAAVLCAADTVGVPFKATAGLHHPLPSLRGGLPMHGFVNVFGGAALLHADAVDAAALAEVLAERDPAAFDLGDDGSFAWRDVRLDAGTVDDARAAFALSIGSCSFDEPVDDLRAMGVRLTGT